MTVSFRHSISDWCCWCLAVAAWTIARARGVRRSHRLRRIRVATGAASGCGWRAVDIALTEAAIGSGVTGMLLLRAATAADGARADHAHPAHASAPAAACFARPSLRACSLVLSPPDPRRRSRRQRLQTCRPPASAIRSPPFSSPSAPSIPSSRRSCCCSPSSASGRSPLTVTGAAHRLPWRADRDGRTDFSRQDPSTSRDRCGLYVFWTGADHPGGAFQGERNSVGHVDAGDDRGAVATCPRLDDAACGSTLVAGAALFLATGSRALWSRTLSSPIRRDMQRR